jgi:hypothetical protein
MIIGVILCFGLFGFLATWVLAKLQQCMGILRKPKEVELAGADTSQTPTMVATPRWRRDGRASAGWLQNLSGVSLQCSLM